MGGVETIMARGHLYMLLKPDQQSQVSRGFPKWWGKGVDAFMESYMNALLLAPPTQIVNIASNAVFQLMQIPERFIAGMIGSARTSVGIGSKDQVHMAETLAGPMGWMMSFKDSLKASGKAFVTEDPSDLTTKIDYRTRKAITAENFEINPEKYPTAAAAVVYIGFVFIIG